MNSNFSHFCFWLQSFPLWQQIRIGVRGQIPAWRDGRGSPRHHEVVRYATLCVAFDYLVYFLVHDRSSQPSVCSSLPLANSIWIRLCLQQQCPHGPDCCMRVCSHSFAWCCYAFCRSSKGVEKHKLAVEVDQDMWRVILPRKSTIADLTQ